MVRSLFILLAFTALADSFAQSATDPEIAATDTTRLTSFFTYPDAWEYLQGITHRDSIWKTTGDSVKSDLVRLLMHTSEPFDSVEIRLRQMDFRSVKLIPEYHLIRDSMLVRWLNDSTFILDSLGWNLELLMNKEMRINYPVDFSTLVFSDSILDEKGMLDSTLFIPDTVLSLVIDTVALESLEIPMYGYRNNEIIPSLHDYKKRRSASISTDSASMIFTDTLIRWTTGDGYPFQSLTNDNLLDSVQQAIESLLRFSAEKDSTRLLINDMYGRKSQFWITSGNSDYYRFWVKNYKNDSITLWIGNPARNEITLLLEDDIDLNRLEKEEVAHIPVKIPEPDLSLASIELLEAVPVFWDYEASSAFSFNQTYLSNWTKGGENSLATMLDMMGQATYNNKTLKTQWINSARLQYGTIITQEHGLRKNNDLFEINSQLNRNKWGKIDLSASFYMKNQLAKGYKYPNDSVVVSKFLNPGTLTIGLGIDYKPFKHTSINMAPLSYKNTFVLDTANIDQTKHGIEKGKRARQELGTQFLIKNRITPMEDLTISNQLRLFSNYLNHPENIDIDWEMLLDKKISWFFTIRLNLHLIYDDDIRFTVMDADDQPVLLPDGSEKKAPKAQFKEFVGLSLLFKL